MDPVTTLAAKSIMSTVSKKFAGSVIERWTRHRAEMFFDGFAVSLARAELGDLPWHNVNDAADAIFEDEQRSEILYDAYRRVCFSKSRDFGPRILGMLIAPLVVRGLTATDDEEAAMRAAEMLGDADLIELETFYDEYSLKALNDDQKDVTAHGDEIVIEWCDESIDSERPYLTEVVVSALDLSEALGDWARRAQYAGIIDESVTAAIETYSTRSERYDGDGTLFKYRTSIILRPAAALVIRHLKLARS